MESAKDSPAVRALDSPGMGGAGDYQYVSSVTNPGMGDRETEDEDNDSLSQQQTRESLAGYTIYRRRLQHDLLCKRSEERRCSK